MADKKSFVLYNDTLNILDKLTDEQAGRLFRMIKAFQTGDTAALEALQQDIMLNLVFTPFEAQFQRDRQKYESICFKRSENIKKRWEKVKETEENTNDTNVYKCIQKHTSITDSDSDSDSDSESDSESDIDNNISVCDTRTREKSTPYNSFAVEQLTQVTLTSAQAWCETFCMNNHINLQKLEELLQQFTRQLQDYGEERKTIEDFKHHFAAWYNKTKNNGNSNYRKQTIAEQRQRASEQRNAERMARIIKLAEEA